MCIAVFVSSVGPLADLLGSVDPLVADNAETVTESAPLYATLAQLFLTIAPKLKTANFISRSLAVVTIVIMTSFGWLAAAEASCGE